MAKIFIVDDDEDILLSLQYFFTRNGYDVSCFDCSATLLSGLDTKTPDVVLLDVNLGAEDGRKICKFLKNQNFVVYKVILFSANPANLENYREYLADAAIEKPFALTEIKSIVSKCIVA